MPRRHARGWPVPLLILAACGSPDEALRQVSYDAADFTRFDLRIDAGDATIVPGDEASVDATLSWIGDVAPELESRLAGGTLLVSVTCPEGSRACGSEVRVVLPAATEIDLLGGASAIRVERMTGPLDLVVQSGSVTVVDTMGPARIEVDAGTIALENLQARFDASTGSGDISGSDLITPIAEARSDRGAITLSFAEPPDLADLSTASGDITVDLPGGEYDVDITSRRGDISVDGVINTSNAASVVLARSIRGDIRVSGR